MVKKLGIMGLRSLQRPIMHFLSENHEERVETSRRGRRYKRERERERKGKGDGGENYLYKCLKNGKLSSRRTRLIPGKKTQKTKSENFKFTSINLFFKNDFGGIRGNFGSG